MKIKTKLRLGFGFLFVVVLFFGAISLHYMNKIAVSSKVILKDNYESLRFARSMRAILDDHELPLPARAIAALEVQLRLEEKNVTEKGEAQAVAALAVAFRQLSAAGVDEQLQRQALKNARLQLRTIDELNMKAIVRKNDAAQASGEKAATYLIFAASMCFLILFSFVINFPGFVANPLREFSEAIKEISRKNYKQRLEFNGRDEFSELAREFNAMAAQLNKWEDSNLAKLQSEKLRIETIIGQMDDAIVGLNERKEVLFLNKVAAQLLNMTERDTIGSNVQELVKKNDLLKRILLVNGDDKPMKIYADGKESYFQLEKREIMISVYEDGKGQVLKESRKNVGEVYILKNITQYKELDEAKTNFIATVSHELKTPISSIKMSLKLLDDERVGSMNTEQKELVQHIKEDCGRLLKITSELLDLSQVETGNLQLNFVKSDPRKIAIYAMDAVRFQAEQKSIELELISRNDLPKVNVDTEKTAWVLVNFLSNALRYSSAKSKVVIQIVESGDHIEFSVRDFGKGIDMQYQKRLFDRYFQVPTDGNNKSGSGLGLAISKDFIEAEGGKIWVESAIGEGSRFCFLLPVVE
ncbi:two-component sensor histidine kinase [Pedobacter sp. BAL39]|uniref:HAMP domain-containing sensor histidine kinase n=1 Tax=Pedobacter sp. BAL39 TaxID=391596 RepID=UPI000155AB51|nr:ATP-binding protein [Pedobacter sp. BAL39]EDM34192.1 two-component sensor histidine kinase [Pedobacter sp. BAL39]